MRRIVSLLLVSTLSIAMAVPGAGLPQKKLKMRIAVEPVNWSDRQSVGSWYVPAEFKAAIHEKLQKKLADSGKVIVVEWSTITEAIEKKAKVLPAQVMVKSRVTEFDMSQASSGGGINVGGIGRVGGNVTVGKMVLKMKLSSVDTEQVVGESEAVGNASKTGLRFDGNHKMAFADFQSFERSPLGEATSKAVDDAAKKILAQLEKTPWSCRIADFDSASKEITLSAGSEAGVSVGDVFEVHRVTRTVKDDQTGEVLGVRTQKVGTIKVTEVDQKFAFAKIDSGEGFESGLLVREVGK